MYWLNIKYFYNRSDFFGRASLVFRYAAYIFNAIYLLIFLDIKGIPLDVWHIISCFSAIILPYLIFIYYVKKHNDKGIGIRQNMIDFAMVGWYVGLIHLTYLPTFIFILGLICNYVASRGFHKFYRVFFILLGYLLTVPIYGFQFSYETPELMLQLVLIYALVHFIAIAFISYKFSKNVQIVNRKVTLQQREIISQSEELQTLNDSLKTLNNHLEEKVFDRTKELQLKNEKLAEYTFINGHQLRAPVATMLGLSNLLDYAKKACEKEEIITRLKEEVKHLDTTIQEIRLKLETDQLILNEVREVETEHSKYGQLDQKIKDQ